MLKPSSSFATLLFLHLLSVESKSVRRLDARLTSLWARRKNDIQNSYCRHIMIFISFNLEYPWEKWTVFLHPAQQQMIEQDYNGPVRISGSAGTGKTIVALHRAVSLARSNPDSRVLLTTFSVTLANALHSKLRRLISNEPRIAERLEVQAIDAIGKRLYEMNFGRPQMVTSEN